MSTPAALGREIEALASSGQADEAERRAREALASSPSAPVEHALAAALLRKGDRAGATAAYERAIAIDAGYARSLNNLANLLLERTPPDRERALDLYERAVQSPDATANMRLNRARCLHAMARPIEARTAFEEAIARDGASAKALLGLAQTFRAEGRESEAAARLEAALDEFPDDEALLAELGTARLAAGDARGALEPLERANAKLGARTEAGVVVQLARALRMTGRLVEARRVLARIEGRSDLPAAAFEEQASLLLDLGRPGEAARAFLEAEARLSAATKLRVACSRIFGIAHDDAFDAASLGAAATAWGLEVERTHGEDAGAPRWDEVDPSSCHLAFFSGDFRDHVVMRFFGPLLDALAARVGRITLFSTTRPRDGRTEALARRFDFVELAELSRDDARSAIARAGPSVLVDLGAHTSARLDVLSPRLAPVQLHYLGFPGPIGLRSIDYRVTDAAVDPEGTPDVDRHLVLDRCAWVYRVTDSPPVPRTPGSAPRFGCFARAMKISAATTRLWSAILRRSPRATLALGARAYEDPETFAEVSGRFDAEVRSRIHALPWAPTDAEARARHAGVDVILDTFPYHGTTTTCDAFCAGRPVVSLRGSTPPSRVASSLLGAVGLGDLVATSTEEYVEKAVLLAGDADRLAKLDVALPARLREGALGDPEGLAESLLRAIAKHAAARA